MPSLSAQDQAKKAVGAAAVERYVEPGMLVGLGSGTTSRWFVRALGAAVADGLTVRGVPTSSTTTNLATSLGIPLAGFDEFDRLELIVDGADEIDPRGNIIKGGGASLLWERIVADAADRYVVIADSDKLRDELGAGPLPIEVVQYGWESTTRSIDRLLRLHGFPLDVPLAQRASDSGSPVVTDSGNFIVDAHLHSIPDPTVLDRELNWIPGVVENGLFTGLADEVLFANTSGELTVMDCHETPAARSTTTPHGLRITQPHRTPPVA
ncbi:MAG: ribose-5-phosphate isomerase RpiA [Ornithinimicrobium sp.]